MAVPGDSSALAELVDVLRSEPGENVVRRSAMMKVFVFLF